MVRDPRGSVASLAKRMADDRPDTELKVEPRDVVASAIYWRNLAQQELRFARRYPERTIFFRFEDLVTRPSRSCRGSMISSGCRRCRKMVLRGKLDSLVYSASLDAEKGCGLSTKPIERWRAKLSEDAVDLRGGNLRAHRAPLRLRVEGAGAAARAFGPGRAEPAARARRQSPPPSLPISRLREAQLGAAPPVTFAPLRLVAAA